MLSIILLLMVPTPATCSWQLMMMPEDVPKQPGNPVNVVLNDPRSTKRYSTFALGTIERLEAMHRLAAEGRRIANQRESDLRVEVDGLNKEVEKLRAEKGEDKTLQPIIQDLVRRTLKVDSGLTRVREANAQARGCGYGCGSCDCRGPIG
jgi:hypothetical protein